MMMSMPLSIIPIIGSELCERWAYYSVRAVLVLFLTSRLGYSDDASVAVYSYWVAASYLSPFLGGYLADARAGRFATIVAFSAIYLAGMCALAGAAGAAASPGGVLSGLALSALGTGGIKPCVSAFGVDQLPAPGAGGAGAGAGGSAAASVLVSRFFLLFYFSINAGSTLSFVVTPLVRVAAGFDAAFWLSATVLALALAAFLAGSPLYVRLPPGGRSVYA
jgi:dipeptide/tripeptide permease